MYIWCLLDTLVARFDTFMFHSYASSHTNTAHNESYSCRKTIPFHMKLRLQINPLIIEIDLYLYEPFEYANCARNKKLMAKLHQAWEWERHWMNDWNVSTLAVTYFTNVSFLQHLKLDESKLTRLQVARTLSNYFVVLLPKRTMNKSIWSKTARTQDIDSITKD